MPIPAPRYRFAAASIASHQGARFRLIGRWGAALLALVCVVSARADEVAMGGPLSSKLSASMTVVVDGKPYRDALCDIAKAAQLNLWLDRRVDPTAPTALGPVGPTVFAAIEKLAQDRDCVIMPVENVLLVGRPEWVDRTAASILSIKTTAARRLTDVSWPDLTPPIEALAITASDGEAVRIDPQLPHDLWPATHWKQIDQRVAVTLILAQFDRKAQTLSSLKALKSTPATAKGRFTRRYQRGRADSVIRETIKETDRECRVRTSAQWLSVNATMPAHRKTVAAIFAELSQGAISDPDADTFTLKRMDTTAENALQQLAQAAGKRCLIEANARGACASMISIQGTDVTLRTLIDRVAEQAGVVATWKDDTIVISLPN